MPIVGYPTTADGYEKHEKIGFNCWRCSVKGTDANVAIKMHNVDPALDKEKIKVLLLQLFEIFMRNFSPYPLPASTRHLRFHSFIAVLIFAQF